MDIDIAIKVLFPDATLGPDGDVQIEEGVIVSWNRPETQPTLLELEAAWQVWLDGQPERDALLQQQVDAAAFTDLPDWAAYTTAEAVAFIHDAILAGDTLTQAQAKIDALPSTVAGMKTGLKAVAAELITVRGILEKMAKAVVYLRDRT